MRENAASSRSSTTTPTTSEQSFQEDICRTVTQGRQGGVGTPLTFAPLSDLFARIAHYLRSDDTHSETSTFVPLDLFEEVFDSIQQIAGLDDDAGWWCLDQSSGVWFGTGLGRYREQFWLPHDEQSHLTSLHHHGTAIWIAPVDRSLSGVEVVVVAGDPAKNPGEGKTLGESIRRPTVTLLLSSEHPVGLSTASRNIDIPFFIERGSPASSFEGSATQGEWATDSVTFDFRTTQTERTGEPVVEAEFDLTPFRGSYCRVTVVDSAGKRAWSNPVWP